MQEEVVFDTNIYIGIFNRGLYQHEVNRKDVCIALLARQIGATVVTRNLADFTRIQEVVEFHLRDVTNVT